MRPRRRRSSMNRVATMEPVGIHDPRWSGGAVTRDGAPAGTGAGGEIVVIRGSPIDS